MAIIGCGKKSYAAFMLMALLGLWGTQLSHQWCFGTLPITSFFPHKIPVEDPVNVFHRIIPSAFEVFDRFRFRKLPTKVTNPQLRFSLKLLALSLKCLTCAYFFLKIFKLIFDLWILFIYAPFINTGLNQIFRFEILFYQYRYNYFIFFLWAQTAKKTTPTTPKIRIIIRPAQIKYFLRAFFCWVDAWSSSVFA